MLHDLAFLAEPLTPPPTPALPVNVYDILSEGWRETRVDMTLRFFLDPKERHDFGSLVMDALLRCLDGAPLVSTSGRDGSVFRAVDHVGSEGWEIRTQFRSIDVYAKNAELRLGVVIENKIHADLDNPLDTYAARAFADGDVDRLLVVVLAPERREVEERLEPWFSDSITYDEFFDAVPDAAEVDEQSPSLESTDQRRSRNLWQQFTETRRRRVEVRNLDEESKRLDEWRSVLERHKAALDEFDTHKRQMSQLLRSRNAGLASVVEQLLREADLDLVPAEIGGTSTDFWNVYRSESMDWSIELKLTTVPDHSVFYVMDYRGRYKSVNIEDLNVDWSDSDERIAQAFLDRARLRFSRSFSAS